MSTFAPIHYPTSLTSESDEIVVGYKGNIRSELTVIGAPLYPSPIARPATSTTKATPPAVPEAYTPVSDETIHSAIGLPVFGLSKNLTFVLDEFQAHAPPQASPWSPTSNTTISVWSPFFKSLQPMPPPLPTTPEAMREETSMFIRMAVASRPVTIPTEHISSESAHISYFEEFQKSIEENLLAKRELVKMRLSPRAATTWDPELDCTITPTVSCVSLALESTSSSVSSVDSDFELLTPGTSMIGGDELDIAIMDGGLDDEDEDEAAAFVGRDEKEILA